MKTKLVKLFESKGSVTEPLESKPYTVTDPLYRGLYSNDGDTCYPLWIYETLHTASLILNNTPIGTQDLLCKSLVVQLIWYAIDATLALCDVLHPHKLDPNCRDSVKRLDKIWKDVGKALNLKSSALPYTASIVREPFSYQQLLDAVAEIKFLAGYRSDLEIPELDTIIFPQTAW